MNFNKINLHPDKDHMVSDGFCRVSSGQSTRFSCHTWMVKRRIFLPFIISNSKNSLFKDYKNTFHCV
jgi:hypothetical protein